MFGATPSDRLGERADNGVLLCVDGDPELRPGAEEVLEQQRAMGVQIVTRRPKAGPTEFVPCDGVHPTRPIGRSVERGVVPDDRPVVAGAADVGLDVAVPEPDGVLERLDGVLRTFGGTAPVRVRDRQVALEPARTHADPRTAPQRRTASSQCTAERYRWPA